MKKYIFCFISILICIFLFSDNKEICRNLLSQNKLDELFVHLKQWEKSEPQNPEVFFGYYNYYIRKGKESGTYINKQKKVSRESLQIKDPETGEITAYLNDDAIYNIEDITKAFEYINKGLEINPDRLDMHFEKINLLNEIKDYKNASKTLIKVLELSIKNNNKWLLSDNIKPDDGQIFFISNTRDYYNVWYNANTRESLEAIKDAAALQVKLYPKDIFVYSFLATYYAFRTQYSKALEYLMEAEKINPKDTTILNNIAIIYKYLNNKESARKYFEKIIEYGTESEKEYAKGMVKDL